MLKNALDLINRLQTKIEHYKKSRDKYQDDVMYLSKQCDELQAENERFEKAGEEAVSCFHRMESLYNIKCMELKVAKAEAYKEFAERLKETFPQVDWLRSTKRISEDIDNLLKELVGDGSGKM